MHQKLIFAACLQNEITLHISMWLNDIQVINLLQTQILGPARFEVGLDCAGENI